MTLCDDVNDDLVWHLESRALIKQKFGGFWKSLAEHLSLAKKIANYLSLQIDITFSLSLQCSVIS